MEKPLSPTELRANLYQILDEVLATGKPCEITKSGKRLAIVSLSPRPWRMADLPRRTALTCTPAELEAIHWNYAPAEELFP